MLAVEDEVLVDLVGDDEQVVLDAQLGDRARAPSRENTLPVGLCGELSSSSRVRGVIARRELVGVERRSRAGAACTTRRCAPGHRDARGVRVVVRLERDDLVARLAQREQRGGDRLGRAGGDEHLGVGVVVEAVEALAGARRSRARSSGMPMPGGYWLWPARIAATAASSTSAGPSVSGKPWPEVDRAGRDGQRRHLGEDRRAEALHALDEVRRSPIGHVSPGHEAEPHVPARVVAVEVDEHHALPGAEERLAVLHRQRRPSARRSPAARGRRRDPGEPCAWR